MDNEFFKAKETVNKIENKYNLHSLKVDDVYVWGELRNYYYFKIINFTFHQKRRADKSNKKNILKILKNNFNWAKRNDNLIVLGHRKVLDTDDDLSDPITVELRGIIPNTNILDDRAFNGKYHLKYTGNVYHNVDLLFLRKINKASINTDEIKILEDINSYFQEEYNNIDFNINEMLEVVNRLLIDYKYYYKALNKQETKKLYLPSYYSHFAILLAAKDLGIETTEIQYSAINKNHINYDFSTDTNIPYLPKNIILWSRYFNKDFLKYENKYYINKNITSMNSIKKDKIVVISQDLIAEELHELCRELILLPELDGYEIILKQHPWEEPAKYEGINVIDSNSNTSILEVISDAKVVISSFSTVIDEALQLGCKVILYDNGFDKIVDEYYKLDKIKNVGEIVSLIPFQMKNDIRPFDNYEDDEVILYNFLTKKE